MSDETNATDFEQRTKHAFDDSVAALDGATRSRLTQARHRALEELPSQHRAPWRALVPAGALAATALVAALFVWQRPQTQNPVRETALVDLEILLGEEDLEMLDEELEFYGWIEQQPEFASATDSVG